MVKHGRPKGTRVEKVLTEGTRRTPRYTGRPILPERELFDSFDVDKDGLLVAK